MTDDILQTLLDGVVGVVEANSYEKHMLWVENQRNPKPRMWVEGRLGLGQVVGYVGDNPVFVSLLVDEVDGCKILFIDAVSQVVDYEMVELWLKDNSPSTAFRENGFINRTDAMNFHNVFPRKDES